MGNWHAVHKVWNGRVVPSLLRSVLPLSSGVTKVQLDLENEDAIIILSTLQEPHTRRHGVTSQKT